MLRKHIPNPSGNPNFKPQWNHTPTTPIRIPEEFKSILLDVARCLDDGSLSVSDLEKLVINRGKVLENLTK